MTIHGTVVEEDTGAVHTWTIVGPTEADIGEGKLSVESPVAGGLLGHAPGDVDLLFYYAEKHGTTRTEHLVRPDGPPRGRPGPRRSPFPAA